MSTHITLWIGFNVFVVAMLILDQMVFHKRDHEIKMKEAVGWSLFWITLALIFNLGIWHWKGGRPALEFFTGYVIELSLSIDNLFVFIVIFSYFKIPQMYQHKILFWGIVGAQVMRAIFIFAGVALINAFHWIIYVFGIFLIVTGIKMFRQTQEDIHPENNPLFIFLKRFIPLTHEHDQGRFWVSRNGRRLATPLLMALIMIELTDLVFALDSVPAVLAITRDPFIVYTSNIFAILGLRSFYFVLARMMGIFHYLHYGLSIVLIFVGVKMLIGDIYHIPIAIALGVVITTLFVSIAASLVWPQKKAGL